MSKSTKGHIKHLISKFAALAFVFILVLTSTNIVQAKTVTKLSNGKYYYCDDSAYGKTYVKMKNGKLSLNGSYEKQKGNDMGKLKKAKLKLNVSKNVKIIGWIEGESQKVTKKEFASWVQYGCALDLTIKNNKVVRIDVSPFSG